MQHIPAQAEFLQHAGAEVLDEDVRLAEQLFQHLTPGLMLEVKGDRLFVACLHKPPQRRALIELAPLAQWVAAVGRLDLDHLGTKLGTNARGKGAGDQGAEFDHFQAGEGFVGQLHRVSIHLAECATLT